MSLDKYKLICRFMRAEKPPWLLAIDVSVVTRLLTLDNVNLDAYVSHSTLAAELASSESTIKESIYRLKEHGWLTVVSGKRSGRVNTYTVQVEALPLADDLKRTIIGAEAMALAKQIYHVIHTRNPKKKIYRGWQQRFGIAIQRRLNTGLDATRIIDLLNFAFTHPKFIEKAMKGPNALRQSWPRLETMYDASKVPALPVVPVLPTAPCAPKIDWDAIERKANAEMNGQVSQ